MKTTDRRDDDDAASGGDEHLIARMLEPYRLGSLTLPSRFVMAPMTRDRAPGNVLTKASVDYYRRRAETGIGLIVTEGTWIDHPAANNHPQAITRLSAPNFHGDEAMAAWTDVLAAVHRVGTAVFPQLWHVGLARRAPGSDYTPAVAAVSPSGIVYSTEKAAWVQAGEPMTQHQIDDVVASYGRAARLARDTGFDGIEIHAAHGYLIDQFLWDVTNRRSDGYGGDIDRRTRFACEVVAACRRATGPGFPISFRFSQWKADDYNARIADGPDELERILGPLIEAGVDIFHCSTRRYWAPAFEGSNLTLAGWTKKISGKTVICVGSIGLGVEFDAKAEKMNILPAAEWESLVRLQEMHDRGEFDLAAVGRSLLANPDWLAKVRTGRFDQLRHYTPDMKEVFY